MKLINGVYLYETEDFNKGLDEFLKGEHTLQKGQNMVSKERLIQVRKDIKLLQEEEKRIEKELAKDPIERYIEEHPFPYSLTISGISRSVFRENNHLLIVLPIANDTWTWAAYQWAKDFCEAMRKIGKNVYPVHREEYKNHKYLYIWLGE